MEKTLYDISWKVLESEYRADSALSYSLLAKYEREGFDKLDTLFEHISTPSLILGSCVDTMITGGKEEFDKLFFVGDFPSVGDKERQIAESLFRYYGKSIPDMRDLATSAIITAAASFGFQPNWRDETRVRVLVERCAGYYSLLSQAQGRTLLNKTVYDKAINMVRALRESPSTSGYFAEDSPHSSIRRYYQLKFKATFNRVDYRCMADLLLVDYEKKEIIPCDLKTSGHPEWNFQESFLQWLYPIQARLYWRIIKANIDEDPYFKEFSLQNYRFIVVNKSTLTPLVWEFPLTKTEGTLIDDKGNKYRDPFVIGRELQCYLKDHPRVPEGIDLSGKNIISCLKQIDNIE